MKKRRILVTGPCVIACHSVGAAHFSRAKRKGRIGICLLEAAGGLAISESFHKTQNGERDI